MKILHITNIELYEYLVADGNTYFYHSVSKSDTIKCGLSLQANTNFALYNNYYDGKFRIARALNGSYSNFLWGTVSVWYRQINPDYNDFIFKIGNNDNFIFTINDVTYTETNNIVDSELLNCKFCINGKCKYLYFNDNEKLIPAKLKGTLYQGNASDAKIHYEDECGMFDIVNNIFYANESAAGTFTVENKIDEIKINGDIKYIALANSNNTVFYPKKVYFANSNNTLKLVYERPIYDIHIINLAINTKLGNADKVSEIKFTNNLNLRNLAYDDNVVDVTYQNNIPTYEFLVQNDDNDTFTCYIANAFYGENSKIYCYGDFNRCFMNCSILTTIPVSNFETSNVTSMFMFFEACTNATTIDVSNFNTSNVTSMFCMFRGCRNVTELKVSNFNTSKLTSIAWMFTGCLNVTELEVSKFDTSRCTSMYALFQGCNKITELDVSHFDTSNVKDMYAMFSNCIKLESLDVSSFDTSKVTNMRLMFTNLQSIKRLDISNFNISSVTSLNSFIRNCYKLEYLKLPILNTLNAIDCNYMFNYNPKLISLNLNSFSTDNCKHIVYLLSDNYSLRRIFANILLTSSLENHTLDDGVVVPGDYDVFRYNRALKGGNGTTYDANHIDSEYARIDGENGLPGYFTDPADAIKITLINVDNEGYTDEIYLCVGDTYTIPELQGYTAVINSSDGDTYSDGDTITITQDITLTFVWSAVNN